MPKIPYNKRPDGRYYKQIIIGRDENGKRKVKTLYDKDWKKLDKKVREFQTELTQGVYIEEDITFGECAELWLKSKINIAGSTRVQYKSCLNYFLPISYIKMKQIKPIHLQGIFNNLTERGIIAIQKNLKTMILHQLYTFAINNNFADTDMSSKIVIKQNTNNKRRALYDWEKDGIMTFLKEPYTSKRILKYQTMVAILFFTGIRMGEMLSLNLQRDISLENNTIAINHTITIDQNCKVIEKQGTKKQGLENRRVIPIPPLLKQILEEYVKQFKITDYLFLTCHSRFISTHESANMWMSIRKQISKYIPENPVLEFTPHYLRHNYATELIYANIPLKTVQYLMGHKNIQMTMNIYADVRKDDESINEMVRSVWD